MKNIYKAISIATILSLVLAGCTKSVKTAVISPTPIPALTSIPTAAPLTLTLKSIKNSKQAGTAVLTDVGGGKTQVTITLTGESSTSSEPSHIHAGSCLKPGNVMYPLSNVVNGKSQTIINTSVAILQASGATSLNVHESEKLMTNYVACADIPLKLAK